MPFAFVNGTQLHYEISGTGDPIVWIHPPLLTEDGFAYQKEQLAAHFRIITFNIRGHGLSRASECPLTIELIAEDIVKLLNELGIEQAYVCGYSTGSMVLLEALLTHPERFLGGIIVSGTPELTDLYNVSRAWVACRMAGSDMLMKLLRTSIAYGNADKLETFHQLKERALTDARDDVCSYFKESLSYSCTLRLRNIRHPILLIYGQKDRAFNRYAKLLHDQLPNSSLYYLKDAKHQIPTKYASKMNDLVRLWIDSLQDEKTERPLLDLAIAKKLNPAMYGESEEERLSEDELR
ncbi:alpha/beta fold hydrolase [Paenibacillus sp. GCM10023248]|uniref:alpha/beta fold hydrolase n=1 Tax=unclassified Paenibacillus TaxID=185978 RepID=UPI0023780788|nr:alpha/beta hydrolase [Paenibacillus sp. MAHUQ-63]MDD9271322.1 alpha/beta hydrolase [Paenibacillus sp. MAHUQ-63]